MIDFCQILGEHLRVNFIRSSEISGSLLDISSKIREQTRGYIPGRPQLVLNLGLGEWDVACERLRRRLHFLIPLIRLCQLTCDVMEGVRFTGDSARMPDHGRAMPEGITEIPCTALGVNVNNGTGQTWDGLWTWRYELHSGYGVSMDELTDERLRFDRIHTVSSPEYGLPFRQFESSQGGAIEPHEFRDWWMRLGRPLESAFTTTQTGRNDLIGIILEAIRVVSSCIYGVTGDIGLQSVLATEWILNPVGGLRWIDQSEAKSFSQNQEFAVRACNLASTFPGQIEERRERAKELYKWRNDLIHTGGKATLDAAETTRNRKDAFHLFIACLEGLGQWLSNQLESNQACSAQEFDTHLRIRTRAF